MKSTSLPKDTRNILATVVKSSPLVCSTQPIGPKSNATQLVDAKHVAIQSDSTDTII